MECPRIFMTVDKNRDPEELSVFELMLFLEDRGWECRTAGSRDEVDALRVADELAVPSIFWIKATDTAFDAKYVLVLALACTSVKFLVALKLVGVTNILHLKRSEYYAELLEVFRLSKRAKAEDIIFESDLEPTPIGGRGLAVVKKRQQRHKTYRLQESFKWGQISFKYRQPTKREPRAGYQVDCPRRSHIRFLPSGGRSMCCTTARFLDGQRDNVVAQLKYWAASCMKFEGRQKHQAWMPQLSEVPNQSTLQIMAIPEDRPLRDDEGVRAMQGVKLVQKAAAGPKRKARRRKGLLGLLADGIPPAMASAASAKPAGRERSADPASNEEGSDSTSNEKGDSSSSDAESSSSEMPSS